MCVYICQINLENFAYNTNYCKFAVHVHTEKFLRQNWLH